jgi:hypothetical protein
MAVITAELQMVNGAGHLRARTVRPGEADQPDAGAVRQCDIGVPWQRC